MRVGVWLHDHFYRKHCGRPMVGVGSFYEEFEGGIFYLGIEEVCRVTPEVLKELMCLGVECAEVGGPLTRLEAMAPCLKDRGDITLVLHTEGDPDPTRCGSGNSHLRRAAVEAIKWNIDLAAELGACTYVVHPPREDEFAVESLRECSEYALERGVTLALENSGAGIEGVERILRLAEEVGSDGLEFTFDTGHANLKEGSPLECAKILGARIAHVHWHDNDGSGDQHLAPGMGNIDFGELMAYLMEVEAKRGREITLTLECDKPIVDYEKAWAELRKLRDRYLKKATDGS